MPPRRFPILQWTGRLQLSGRVPVGAPPMVSINCDMGESFGIWRLGDDAAPDAAHPRRQRRLRLPRLRLHHMRATVRLARAHGRRGRAHPSLPDRQGFGRREMKIGREELANCLIYQIGALQGLPRRGRARPQPHQAARRALRHGGAGPRDRRGRLRRRRHLPGADPRPARDRARARLRGPRPRPGGGVLRRPRLRRRRRPDHHPRAPAGRSRGRHRPGPAAIREGVVAAHGGARRAGRPRDSICIHSDTPGAADLARTLRRALDRDPRRDGRDDAA